MNGLCDKLISDNDTENLPQKEIPLYMPKDKTKNYNICHMKVSVLNRRKRYPLMKILDELDYGLNLSYG